MSQSCRAHLFFGARLIQQNPRFEIFFAFLIFTFFSAFYELSCQNIQEKIWQTQWNTSNNRLLQLCVLSCIMLIQKSSSIFQSCDRLKSETSAAQEKKKKKKKKTIKKKKKKKKTAFRSGLPICHELWDIAFIFFSLIRFLFHTFWKSPHTASLHHSLWAPL